MPFQNKHGLPDPARMRERSAKRAIAVSVTGTELYKHVVKALNETDGYAPEAATVQGTITHEYVDVIMDWYDGIHGDLKYLKPWLRDRRYYAEQISVNGSRIGLRVCWDSRVTAWMLGIKSDIDDRPICPCNACGKSLDGCQKDKCALYGHYLHFTGMDGDL